MGVPWYSVRVFGGSMGVRGEEREEKRRGGGRGEWIDGFGFGFGCVNSDVWMGGWVDSMAYHVASSLFLQSTYIYIPHIRCQAWFLVRIFNTLKRC